MRFDGMTTLAGTGLGLTTAGVTLANTSTDEVTFWLGLVAAILQVALGYMTNK